MEGSQNWDYSNLGLHVGVPLFMESTVFMTFTLMTISQGLHNACTRYSPEP